MSDDNPKAGEAADDPKAAEARLEPDDPKAGEARLEPDDNPSPRPDTAELDEPPAQESAPHLHPSEVAEGDEAEPGAGQESALHLYPSEVDEPSSDEAGPALSPDTSEVAEGDEHGREGEVAEGDGPGWEGEHDSTIRFGAGEVDGVDEPEPTDLDPTTLLDTGEVAEGDEAGAAEVGDEAEGDGVDEGEGWVEGGEGGPRGMSAELEGYLEEADERAAEDSDEGRYDAPPLPPLLILAVVGLLAGFVTVGLVWLSEQGCDRVRNSPNCGAAGFPLLIVVIVIAVVLGGLALSRLAMPHPKLVAFLGVGFMLLIVLAFLSNDLFSTWTLLVVPVLTAITFLVAHLIAGRLERADA
jgi:hypothetical protein